MATKKTLTVNYVGGVCIREEPNRESKIIRIASFGEKVTLEKADAPAGWTAVTGGYTMTQFLK